jgi:hypothetical protein
MTYPGTTAVPVDVNNDSGVIRMTVPLKYLKAQSGLDAKGRPKQVAAVKGSRLYSGTAFTMGNVSVPEGQGYLYPVDGSAAMDFLVGAAAAKPATRGTGSGTGGTARPPAAPGGTLPTTGGLGWPLGGVLVLGAALLLARSRRTVRR